MRKHDESATIDETRCNIVPRAEKAPFFVATMKLPPKLLASLRRRQEDTTKAARGVASLCLHDTSATAAVPAADDSNNPTCYATLTVGDTNYAVQRYADDRARAQTVSRTSNGTNTSSSRAVLDCYRELRAPTEELAHANAHTESQRNMYEIGVACARLFVQPSLDASVRSSIKTRQREANRQMRGRTAIVVGHVDVGAREGAAEHADDHERRRKRPNQQQEQGMKALKQIKQRKRRRGRSEETGSVQDGTQGASEQGHPGDPIDEKLALDVPPAVKEWLQRDETFEPAVLLRPLRDDTEYALCMRRLDLAYRVFTAAEKALLHNSATFSMLGGVLKSNSSRTKRYRHAAARVQALYSAREPSISQLENLLCRLHPELCALKERTLQFRLQRRTESQIEDSGIADASLREYNCSGGNGETSRANSDSELQNNSDNGMSEEDIDDDFAALLEASVDAANGDKDMDNTQ